VGGSSDRSGICTAGLITSGAGVATTPGGFWLLAADAEAFAALRTMSEQVSWVTATPFALPVEPEVYCR
jgi:hypothetical protein